jgi:alpha-L-fucosidase 2
MQYRHSMDDAMLRDRLLPRMKRAMNYYLHVLEEGPDGKLHVTKGYSPEYPGQPSPNPDCNIDLGLIRWLAQALIDSCTRLKIDDPLIPKWKDTLARLTPYPVNENGLMVSAKVPWVESHRHYSHLLMIYPLYVMNWEQPESRELITKSFDHWMKNPSAFRGYSWTGAASICAQIGRNNQTVEYLNYFVDAKGRYGLLPNTHYLEAGPVIETPLSAARTLQDMVIQSWGDKIRVFPGIPDAWKDLTFHNLRAEGAFLVSASRKDGKTEWVRVQSLAGEPCRVKTDMADVASDRELKSVGDGVVEIQLAIGDSALLYPKGQQSNASVAPVPIQEGRTNTFGLPK